MEEGSRPKIARLIGTSTIAILCAVFQVCILPYSNAQAAEERISCFVIGIVNPVYNPFTVYFDKDPLFLYSMDPVPPYLTIKEKQKLDRLYYPRTRKHLVEGYEFMVFADPWIEHFTTKQLHDLDYAFREAGMSAFSSFGHSWTMVWLATILRDIWPISEYVYLHYRAYNVKFRPERDPIFEPFIELGIEKIQGNAYHEMTARPGSTLWADMKPQNLPWLVSWRPGGGNAGMIWVVPGAFDPAWWGVGRWMDAKATRPGTDVNPYAIDFATNLILYSLDRPLITDLLSRREARRLLSEFQTQKLLVLYMMEWADNFGANTLSLSTKLTGLEAGVENATMRYLEQEYQSTISLMQHLSSQVIRLTWDAVELKEEALFWVFVIEWLVVTSAGIVAGTMVWSLMVQRKMYKAAGQTKLKFMAD